jgi:hypothetical protein
MYMYVCTKIRITQSVQQVGYGLDSPGFESQQEARYFAYLQNVQTGSGAHPASYSKGTVVLSLGVKRPVRDFDHSPPV